MRPTSTQFLGEVWGKGLAAAASANPSSFLVAGARNHLPANRPLAERDRGIVARLQEEIGRFNRELEGRQKSRDELKKLLPE